MNSLRVLHTHLLIKQQRLSARRAVRIGSAVVSTCDVESFLTVLATTSVVARTGIPYPDQGERPSASRQVFERARRLVLNFAQFERAEPGNLFLGVRRWLHHDKSGAGMFGPNPKVVRSDLNCPVMGVITARIDRHSELSLCQLHHVSLATPLLSIKLGVLRLSAFDLRELGPTCCRFGPSFLRAGDR
jgi:hypothetical protein